jgi:purine-binding chemotaxis protein CheW
MNALVAIGADAFDAGPDDDAAQGLADVGLMRLCGRDLAVPAGNVREVVPLPAMLHPSFSGGDGAAGSIVVRGKVIPVLDIAERLGFAPRGDREGVVLILRHEQALIGIIMDSVSGLARVARDTIQPFAVTDPAQHRIVPCSFPWGELLVGLIDPAAVLALPGVPHAREQALTSEASAMGASSAVVLITIAGTNLALDSASVVAIVPSAQLRPSPATASKWVGVVQYLGQEIPVVDDLALFGMAGRAGGTPGGAVIIVRLGEKRMVGVRIDRVKRILPLTERALRPLPPELAQQLPLFRGAVVDHAGEQNLLLDGEALAGSDALRMIGALGRYDAKPSAGVSAGVVASEARQPFLVFMAGGRRRAAALASVKQIIPLPETRSALARDGSGLKGLASHNGAPLPLLEFDGQAAATDILRPNAVVLVIEKQGGFNGLVVDQLETIARSVVHRRPGRQGADAASFFIEAELGGKKEAVTLCDLFEAAARAA